MNQEKIDRINELYHKSKAEGLTPAEKEEQAKLRKEYIANIRAKDAYYNVAGDTEYMKCDITKGWENEDGTITELSKLDKTKKGN